MASGMDKICVGFLSVSSNLCQLGLSEFIPSSVFVTASNGTPFCKPLDPVLPTASQNVFKTCPDLPIDKNISTGLPFCVDTVTYIFPLPVSITCTFACNLDGLVNKEGVVFSLFENDIGCDFLLPSL